MPRIRTEYLAQIHHCDHEQSDVDQEDAEVEGAGIAHRADEATPGEALVIAWYFVRIAAPMVAQKSPLVSSVCSLMPCREMMQQRYISKSNRTMA